MDPQTDLSSAVKILFTLFYSMPIWGLIVTWLIGRTLEKKHYQQIKEREAQWLHVPAVNAVHVHDMQPVESAELVVGVVVVSVDYFKRWLSSFRKIFGGEMKSYSSVIDRGRREAILRMKEACPDADLFLNCRLQTSTISNGKGEATGCAEVLAYGTAIRFQKSA